MPGLQIADALSGKSASVDDLNRLQVRAVSEPIQHWISHDKGLAFQAIGEQTLAAGTIWPLFIKNTDPSQQIVVTYIRHQIVDETGGTVLPNVDNYLKVSFNTEYTSGGTPIVPVNMHRGKANAPLADIHTGATINTTNEIISDKWFTKDEGDMYSWNKEASLILGPGQTMGVGYTGDQTSGTIFVRISFIVMASGE